MPELLRRQFLAGSGALFLLSCRVMSQVRASDHLIERPEPTDWHRVMRALAVSVLPFEHPAFPRVTPDEVLAQMGHLFQVDDDPGLETLPRALMLFDDTSLLGTPPAPIVDDERRDLAMSRVLDIEGALRLAFAHDGSQAASYAQRFGGAGASFSDQSLEARRAYLAMWGASAFVTRRRFYRGVKALVGISAYSMKPFWDAVGYEGPLLRQG
jgi:hypothetical protein